MLPIGLTCRGSKRFIPLIFLFSFALCFANAVSAELREPPPSLKALNLDRQPAMDELMAAGQLGGTLHPTETAVQGFKKEQDDLSFGNAIQVWNSHEYDRAANLFKEHRSKFPDSPWNSEAVLHLGCYAYYHGRFAESEEAFNWILSANKNKKTTGSKALFNKAKLRLGVLRVAQNRSEEAQELFRELKEQGHDWRHKTYASAWLQRISRDNANKLALLNCGTQALAYVLQKRGDAPAAEKIAGLKANSLKGYSIEMLSTLATQHGVELTAVRFLPEDLERVSPPYIVYVDGGQEETSGHFLVVDKIENGEIELFDPQAKHRSRQTTAQFAGQWGGIALVVAEAKLLAGTPLTAAEKEEIFGGCCGVARPTGTTGCDTRNQGPWEGG